MLGYWFLLQVVSGIRRDRRAGRRRRVLGARGRFRRGRAAQPRVPQPRDARAASVLRLEPEGIADAELASRAALAEAPRAFGPFAGHSCDIGKISGSYQHSSGNMHRLTVPYRRGISGRRQEHDQEHGLLSPVCWRLPCASHAGHRAGEPTSSARPGRTSWKARRMPTRSTAQGGADVMMGLRRQRHRSSSVRPDDEVLEAVGDGTDTVTFHGELHVADPRGEPHARRHQPRSMAPATISKTAADWK